MAVPSNKYFRIAYSDDPLAIKSMTPSDFTVKSIRTASLLMYCWLNVKLKTACFPSRFV